jgi:hypothetical protein
VLRKPSSFVLLQVHLRAYTSIRHHPVHEHPMRAHLRPRRPADQRRQSASLTYWRSHACVPRGLKAKYAVHSFRGEGVNT